MADCWLKGKTVIVTGASGGIGAGISETLIKKHGCIVIGVARSEPKMLKFIEELGPTYAKRFSYKLFDVSVRENWENFAEEIKTSGIGIDVLVNNAGILPKFTRFDRYSEEEIEQAMNINFYSAVYSSRVFLPILLESDEPGIINIDSSAALMSMAGTSVYSASKAALKSFTESMREELRGKCYVSVVCPGFTKTDIMHNQSKQSGSGEKMVNMVSTHCDRMVQMIMFGIEKKMELRIYGIDAHFMSVFNKLMPVGGSRIFTAVQKAANIDLFKDVFRE